MATSIFDYLHFPQPTNEQSEVLRAMEQFVDPSDPKDFMILTGAAGTGKTSITSALIGYLNNREVPYKVAAPTGRAARILGRKSGVTSSTIHSLIYIAEPNKDTGVVKFKLKLGYNSTPCVFIIDEASMIPKNADKSEGIFIVERGLLDDVIQFIKQSNVNNKIIFLGDQYQLPPIGENQSYALDKNFLERTYNLIGRAFHLTEVKRQEDGSFILQNATHIRKAIDRGQTTHPIEGKRSRNIYNAADSYVSGLRREGLDHAVAIGVSHKANKFFNDLVRERIFGKASKVLERGDLLMVVQNWSRNDSHLFNGDHVELLQVDWDLQEQVAGLHFVAVKVKLIGVDDEHIVEDLAIVECLLTPGGRIDLTLENELRRQRYTKNPIFRTSGFPADDRYVGALRLIYGHAITCNKAQGGEWKKVFINTWGIPSLKWQYTAVTRGKEDLEQF